MQDTEERRRQRERLVAYFIGTIVREHGLNLSNQPGAMARLRHFAEAGQEALEEDRLEALDVNDMNIAMGLDGSPLPFRVRIDKKTLRAIFEGAIPPPVDDAASAAARAARLELARRRRADEVEAKRRLESERDREAAEKTERDAAALRRVRTMMIASAVAVVLAIAAIVAFTRARHEEHETKSEGTHAHSR